MQCGQPHMAANKCGSDGTRTRDSGVTGRSWDFRRCRAGSARDLAEAYGNPATALIGDSDKPLTFVLESSFARSESERRELEPAA